MTHLHLSGKGRVSRDAPIWTFYPFPWQDGRNGTSLTRNAGIRQGWRTLMSWPIIKHQIRMRVPMLRVYCICSIFSSLYLNKGIFSSWIPLWESECSPLSRAHSLVRSLLKTVWRRLGACLTCLSIPTVAIIDSPASLSCFRLNSLLFCCCFYCSVSLSVLSFGVAA